MTESVGYARRAINEKTIPYRPHLAGLTGKVTSAILLQQIVFNWGIVKHRAFYKFRAACGHSMYREGDSWTEELGFTGSEFDTALKSIGTKITKGTSREEALSGTGVKNLVIYWTDSNRVTWYELNQALFDRMTDPLYEDGPQEANSGKLNYLVNKESKITRKSRKPELHYTENTTENTTESKPTPKAKEPIPEPDIPLPGTVEPWKGPPPPAARVFQSRMNSWPRRTSYRRIHETVGDRAEDLEFWGTVVSKYSDLGWNKTNVDGMLEWYEKRKLPAVSRRGGNGKGEQNKRIIDGWMSGWQTNEPAIEAEYTITGEVL